MIRVALAVLVAASALGEVPACRYDDLLARDVRAAAELALKTIEPSIRTVVVNPSTPPASDALAIEIVRTPGGCDGSGAADEWSVLGGVCLAERGSPRIRCSAEALAALTAGDRRGSRASAALLYVIAHELGHVKQKDAGAFRGKIAVVHLDRSEAAKWLELRQLCRMPDAVTLAREEDADRQALAVLERAADLDRYRDPLLSPRSAVTMFVERLRLAANALNAWESAQHQELPLPAALTVQTFEPTPENIERTSRRLLCQIRTARSGILGLPNVPDTHPGEAMRLAQISTKLQEKAKALPAGKLGRPPEMPDISQVDETLIPVFGSATAMLDAQQRDFYAALWPHLCATYLNSQTWPDCNDPSPGDGTPDCPLFLGIFDEETLAPAPASVTLPESLDALDVEGRVQAVASDGETLRIALADPNALLTWTDRWESRALPCAPRAVSGTTILCGQPFGFIEGTRFFRFRMGRLNDQRLSPDDVEGTWLGRVGNRLFATLYLSEGRSMTVEITKDGARSADAWRKAGCESLRSGFALTAAPNGRVVGVTVSEMATREVARFPADAGTLQEMVTPDHLQADHEEIGATLACTAAATPSGAACVDVNGTLFDPFGAKPRVIGRVAFSERLRRSRVVHGRLVARGEALFVAAWDSNGWEVHVARGNTATLLHANEETTAALELAVSPARVVVVTHDGSRTRAISRAAAASARRAR